MTRRERADAADAARHALAADNLKRAHDAGAPDPLGVFDGAGIVDVPVTAATPLSPDSRLVAAVRRGLAEGGVPPTTGPGRLATASDARAYALAGRATFTLRSTRTGTRFTFKVTKTKPKDGDARPPVWHVKVLTGPENTTDYEYLGTIFPDGFRHGSKSRIGREAPSAKAFDWFWRRVDVADALPSDLEVWHEGACGRCGRALTVPESISRGIGPECAGIIAGGGR